MKKKYYYSLLILFAMISACKKKDNPQVFTESSFPLAVGDWWQYQLTSLVYAPDTFTVSVVSITTGNPYTQYNCNITGNGVTQPIGYFLQSDTSLEFVNSINPYFAAFPNFHLNFPTQAGEKWLGAFPGDTIKVGSVVQSYTLDRNTYGPCYFLSEIYDLPHNSKVESMILTPKVGLINQSINFNSDTAGKTASYGGGIQIQQSIDLISYHVQ